MNSCKDVSVLRAVGIWPMVIAVLLTGACQQILGIPSHEFGVDDGTDAAVVDGAPVGDALPTPADAADCLPPPSGMVAWWDGDTPGQPGRDILGKYSSTSSLGFPSVMPGKVGMAVEFDEDDMLLFSSTPQPASFTLEAWVQVTLPDMNYIGIYGQYGNACLCTYQNKLTYWDGDVGNGSAGNLATTEDDTLGTDWHHIAVTWNDADNVMRTYIDGVFKESETTNQDVGLTEPADMGALRDNGNPVDQFAGLIDEFSVYDRVLASNDIMAIFNADTDGKCKP